MKQKRILILSLAYYPKFVAGAEVAIKEITDRMPDIEFDMITLRLDSRLPKFEKVGNVNVYRIGLAKNNPSPKDLVRFPLYFCKIMFPIRAVLKFWRLDRKNHYDGIWAMMSYMGMVAVLIRMFARKIQFILTLQEGDSFEHILGRNRIKPFYPIIKKAFREAAVVQVISSYLGNWAKDMGSVDVVVIPNGVDMNKFKVGDNQSKMSEIRKKHGIGEYEKIVVTTSRLVSKNGVDILIGAMKFLPEDVKLLIVGDGPLEEDLRSQVANNDLHSRVIFAGFRDQVEIPVYLASADVFCRPSRSEGQGISFIEAMASGLPVVTTAVGGITDFIIDKETGLFAERDNSEDVARKILILLRDETTRQNIIENAKKLVVEKYDWTGIVARLKSEVFSKFD